jgi:hypothetical protein
MTYSQPEKQPIPVILIDMRNKEAIANKEHSDNPGDFAEARGYYHDKEMLVGFTDYEVKQGTEDEVIVTLEGLRDVVNKLTAIQEQYRQAEKDRHDEEVE